MKTNLLNSSESEVRNNSILYGVTEGAASSAVSVPYVSRKSLVSRLMRTAAVVMLLMTVGVGQVWGTDLYVRGDRNSWGTTEKMSGTSSPWTYTAYWSSSSNFKIADSNWNSINLGSATISAFGSTYNLTNSGSSENMSFPTMPTGGGIYTITVTLVSGTYKIKVDKVVEEGNSWIDITDPTVYFDNSNATYSNVSIVMGRVWSYGSQGQGYYAKTLSKITNTNLYYTQSIDNASGDGSKYTTLLFANASMSGWTNSKQATEGVVAKTSYTGTSNNTLNSNTFLFSAAGSSKGAALTKTDLTGYTDLNKTQTIQVCISEDNGSTYSNAANFVAWPGTINVTRTYLSSATASSSPSATAMTSTTTTGALTSSITFTGASTTEYDFAGWSNSSTSPDGITSKTYTITGASTKYAFYKRKQYTVSYGVNSSTLNGNIKLNSNTAVTTTSSSTLNHGTAISFMATPNPGYQVEGWYSDAECTAGNRLQAGGNSYNAGTLTANVTVYVKFAVRTGGTVTLTAGTGGQVSKTSGSGWAASASITEITSATAIDIYAKANTGYSFSTWTKTAGSGSVTTNAESGKFTPVAYEDATLTASFTETMSALTTSNNYDVGNPSYAAPTISNSATDVGYATTRTITATTPGTGYTFAGWTLTNCTRTDGGAATATTITIRSNGDGNAATAQANYTEDLSSTWIVAGGNKIVTTGNTWRTSVDANNMMTKKTGHSTENVVYYSVTTTGTNLGDTNEDYKFKIVNTANNSTTWYGLTANDQYYMIRDMSGTEYDLSTSGANIELRADIAGTYEIKVDYSGSTPKITITFPTTYTLTYSIGSVAGNNGSISTSPSTTSGSKVLSGTNITLTAPNAETGYTWKGWYTNAAGTTGKINDTNRAITVTMNANKTLYACYTENTFNVKATASPAAGGTVTPTSNTAMGQVTGGDITATPGAGYSFSGWTIASGSGYFGTTGTNTTSATADTKFRPTAASTLTGSFSEVMRTVSVCVNNAAFGTVSTSSLTNVGPATASAEVTATQAAGATFTGWTLQSGVTAAAGYTSSSNPIKVNATDASKTITANFSETKHTITVSTSNATYGTVTPTSASVGQITAVQITATKKAGYKFKEWKQTAGTGTVTYHTAAGTGKATDSSGANKATTYITVTGNVTLQATWEEDPSTGWFLLGEFNSWNTSANEFLKDAGTTTGNISYVRLNLSPDDYSGGTTPFTLKIYNNNDWYGNCNSTSEYTCPQYTINESGVEWSFYKDTDSDPHSNFEVMITVAGVYEFVWNSSTKTLAINYPEYNISLAMSDQVQQGTNLSVDVTARSIKTGSTPGASARYVYEYAAANTAANPLSTYGAWQEFQSSTASNTLSKAAPASIGWYKMRVKMIYEGNTYMSDEKKFAVYNNYIITIKENETTQGWFKMIYAWNNYDNTYQNENYPGEMKDTITSIVDAKTWLYEFKYPYYTKMVINGKDMETNKSDDLEITGHTCLTITGNKEGVANWAVTKEDNCTNTFYRVKTTIGSKTYYSNMVENATDWVSFYANLTDAAKIYIQTSDGATITDHEVTSTYKVQMRNLTSGDPQNHSYDGTTYPGNVFKAKIASNSTLSNLELYKGNYYISCESSAGGTYNYINEGNKFNRFVPDRTSVNEWYNHYYCQWIIAEKPVVATVGNEYNRSLSVTLGADRFCPGGVVPNITNEYHDVNGVRTAYEGNGLNIRFAYDNYSNRFERAALMGSTATLENDVHYLQAYGDYLYKGKTGNEVYSSENGMAVFTDISNYTYQVELYADKTSTIVLEAPIHFHHDGSNLIQYLLGVDAEDTPLRPALLDGESNDRWHMRIIYDYKINRIITAWLVDDTENISENKVLDANMMVTRYADTKSSVISVNTGKSVSAVHKVITVLEFTLEDVRSVGIESGDYVEASFWICLPYDCMVSDVFGIGNYNPDYAALDGNIRKWQICRYAGEKRAQNGWYKPTTTFWYKQDQDGVDYMHAYQGYAVNLKLHKTNDFKVVQVQKKDANGDPMFDGDKPILEDKTLVRIYFPSKDTGEDFTVENETDMQVTLDPYICDKQTATEDRRLKDSNWHLIGNPTYAQARVTTSSVRSNYDWNTYSMSTTVANYTFLYRYDFKKRGDSSRSYVAFDATSQDMYPTFAYMAQWAGVMHWTANSASLKSSNIRRRMAADDEQLRRQVRLELRQTKEDNEEFADQTYINLTDDATEGFDLNLDLEKLNNGNGDLYSLSSVQDDPIQQLAANSMPVQDRTVMLGVNIAENGTYTISMPDETEGLVATLYDSETKQEYNLASESCRVELAKGKYENRFMLILKVTDGSQTTTSTSDAQHQITIAQRDGEFVINGIDEPTQATLYDAVGKQIYQGKIISGSIISTPQSGVYLLHIGSEVYRIMRK